MPGALTMSLTADLHGKTALITGASSGLGAHFTRVLAGAGATVIVAARRQAALKELVAELNGAARALALDVASEASIRQACEAAGPVDILVNNAGVTLTKPALSQTAADFDHVIGTNLRGSFLVATEIARAMRGYGRGGSIINIASILGLRQGGQLITYAVSKAGMIQLTKQLALELAREEIRVNALAPGYIESDLNRDFFTSLAGQALIKRIPQRRLGKPQDLDGPLLLLASDASRFMTGCVLEIDGGHLLSSL
jgi:NAD(P)-dependent dehydrogenase (short-subunit alcohol dehydrogenase family)